jgi:O-antigen/teichoic acid export membrane protein
VAEEVSHLTPTDEITLETVKKRAVSGVVVLTGRTFLLSVISLVATGFLTVFLDPSDFGVFWIVSAIVNFLAYFSDIGLAAALIQKKDNLIHEDLKTTFTIQQLLVVTIIILTLIILPYLKVYYKLDSQDVFLLYALIASLFMSSLKTIPSILLERELQFEKLVIPQVLENLVFNIVAVVLAWKGYGVTSFTYAVILRGITGLLVIYLLKPWLPGFGVYRTSLTKLLHFGVPYQANTLLATLKDDGMTAFLGGWLGASGIGILGWAQKWGQAPLRFFMDHVIKVTFPAFSRMQDEKEQLERSLNRSVFFICLLVFPSLAGLLLVAPILVEIIPKYEKWEPALIPLTFIAAGSIFSAVTTQLTNLLNAIGKIKITFKLMVMWTVLTWAIIPYLAISYGATGAALGYMLVASSSIIAIIIVKRFVDFSYSYIFKPLISAGLMYMAVDVFKNNLDTSLFSLLLIILAGIGLYTLFIYLLVGGSLVTDVKKSFKLLFKR